MILVIVCSFGRSWIQVVYALTESVMVRLVLLKRLWYLNSDRNRRFKNV